MCGIGGIAHGDMRKAEQGIRALNRRQEHRGPDGEGIEIIKIPSGWLALGHRRLAIIDPSDAGSQPMQSDVTGNWITYNGEIYNYPDLKRQLETADVAFRSECDTEVILHLYDRFGTDCVKHLNGMFAFALLDTKNWKLMLARDRFGKKPLYFCHQENVFAFASELQALVASGMIRHDLNLNGLASMLAYGAVPEPLTMYRDAELLQAGQVLILDLIPSESGLTLNRHCYLSREPHFQIPDNEVFDEVDKRLSEGVKRHMLSDVPVGVFLSSGIDSSVIAAIASEQCRHPLVALTVELGESPNIDESSTARETARQLGLKHFCERVDEKEAESLCLRWTQALDQPTVDGLNTFIISSRAREYGIRVALSGLGGDELFGGYSGFRIVPRLTQLIRLSQLLPERLRCQWSRMISSRVRTGRWQKAIELFANADSLASVCLRRRRLFSDAQLHSLGFHSKDLDLNENLLPNDIVSDYFAELDPHAQVSVVECNSYMRNTLLRDSDVAGMANSLEIRTPLLDHELADLVFAIPGKFRVQIGRTRKPLLSECLARRLDSRIHRSPKRGFSLPYSTWMQGPLRDYFESCLCCVADSGLVASDGVTGLWRNFLLGRKESEWSRVWALAMVGAWLARDCNATTSVESTLARAQ